MPEWYRTPSPSPRPGGSLMASAKRITARTIANRSVTDRGIADNWQDDAWDMYDLVGEQRFLAHTLAARMAQARLFVGRISQESQTDDPEPVDAESPAVIPLDVLTGNSPGGAEQLLQRLGSNLYMAGEAWLVQYEDTDGGELLGEVWRACSVDEVKTTMDGTVRVQIGEKEFAEISPDENFVIRIWRPHPRFAWKADASTKASLPVLRELVGLTMHISAQVDSRLAGAGLLIVPKSAREAFADPASTSDDSNEFVDALIEAMLTPISDRGSASALVPLVVTVPDEAADKFKHLTFANELDPEARELRDEAIRRLALSQDAPPEVLLGTGNMNHWGAYLVQEDVVTTHLEPPLALICDALTTQYLRPALSSLGVAHPEQYVIWYDVSHLVVRPNRATEAIALHSAGAITDGALRDAAGFEDSDAPETALSAAATIAVEMVRSSPSLAVDPGLPALVEQLEQVMAGEVPTDITPTSAPSETTPPNNVPSEVGEPVAP